MPKDEKTNWVDKLKKSVQGYLQERKEKKKKQKDLEAYVDKMHKQHEAKKTAKKPLVTQRTTDVEKGLRSSGMSQADIDRLRGKKKGK